MVPEENLSLVVEILDTIDRDALLAVYGMLDADDTSNEIYTKLGAWEHESFHVMGGFLFGANNSDSVWFGVADRNAEQFPWVLGTRSATPLAENPQIQGSARWEGRLLGMTPNARIVAGSAALDIDLTALSGELAFTRLGAVGTTGESGRHRYGYPVGQRRPALRSPGRGQHVHPDRTWRQRNCDRHVRRTRARRHGRNARTR